MNKVFIFSILFLLLPLSAVGQKALPGKIIRMTNEGFEPRELTVKAGEEVTFINEDDTDRWPASNYHPTHTIYPEFDSKQGVAPGESWKFKFEKSGTWRMHDHLIPHMTGSVVVSESVNQQQGTSSEPVSHQEPDMVFWSKVKAFFSKLWSKIFGEQKEDTRSALLKEFKGLNEKEKYVWLEERSKLETPKVAWEYVKGAYNTPEGVVGNPHDMAHLVGQLLFKDEGFSGLSVCEPLFAFGCYHGLMQIAFDKNKETGDEANYKQDLLKAQSGCENVASATSPSYWSCVHGIGHGVATFREFDLKKSLADCDVFSESIRTYCYDGVFMESSTSAPPSFYTKENPIYPCDSVEEDKKTACTRSQVQVMRLRFGMDTGAIANACYTTGNKNIIYHCTDALGYFIAQTASGDPRKIISGCREISKEEASGQCTAAAAGELVFQNARGWQNSVKVICESLKEPYKKNCEERVLSVKKSYDRE